MPFYWEKLGPEDALSLYANESVFDRHAGEEKLDSNLNCVRQNWPKVALKKETLLQISVCLPAGPPALCRRSLS